MSIFKIKIMCGKIKHHSIKQCVDHALSLVRHHRLNQPKIKIYWCRTCKALHISRNITHTQHGHIKILSQCQ